MLLLPVLEPESFGSGLSPEGCILILKYTIRQAFHNKLIKKLFLLYNQINHMTQILVTLDNNADTSLLRRMIENMKGVLATSVQTIKKPESEEVEEWLNNLHEIKRSINADLIDMTDERTRYIMSK